MTSAERKPAVFEVTLGERDLLGAAKTNRTLTFQNFVEQRKRDPTAPFMTAFEAIEV